MNPFSPQNLTGIHSANPNFVEASITEKRCYHCWRHIGKVQICPNCGCDQHEYVQKMVDLTKLYVM